jgi:hypothetical protein
MFIHLDPRRPDVLVPKGFMGQPQLVLQVGLNMAIPIPDLQIDETGISCTLSFNRSPFWCRIPWPAVYALVGEDGRGGVWPDDVPPEIQQQKPSGAGKGVAQKKPRPKLTSVATSKEAPAEAGGDAPPGEAPPQELAPEPARDGELVEAERPDGPLGPQGPPARVALAAVPRDPPDEARSTPAGGAKSTPRQPSPPGGNTAQAARPAQGSSAKRQKREIPPYLRVIK